MTHTIDTQWLAGLKVGNAVDIYSPSLCNHQLRTVDEADGCFIKIGIHYFDKRSGDCHCGCRLDKPTEAEMGRAVKG